MGSWLETLRDALDQVEYGIVLLDSDLSASFINRAFHRMFGLPPCEAGRRYTFQDLMQHGQVNRIYTIPDDQLSEYVQRRIDLVKAGSHPPVHLRLVDGRVLKYECIELPDGGRMLTYADVSVLVHALEQMQALATTDELTRVMNRRAFQDAAQVEIDRARRYGHALSVLMLDADYFKRINDQHGHAVGDDVLRSIATTCKAAMRSSDLMGRLGGEEFGMVLPETPLPLAIGFARKLVTNINSTPVATHAGLIPITVSIGVTELGAEADDFCSLLNKADDALYAAKRRGRDQVCY
ncbi:sensor domain-containing diguanylate cyclase [Chitinimonas naiadis]